MKKELFQINISNPLYKTFVQEVVEHSQNTSQNSIVSWMDLLSVNPKTFLHLMPDTILGNRLSIDDQYWLLARPHRLPNNMSVKFEFQSGTFLLHNQGHSRNLLNTECFISGQTKHPMKINTQSPDYIKYLKEYKIALTNFTNFTALPAPPNVLAELIPDRILSYQLSEQNKLDLIYHDRLLQQDGKSIILGSHSGYISLTDPPNSRPQTVESQQPVYREDCAFSYDLSGPAQTKHQAINRSPSRNNGLIPDQ
jgi:hypothetical protein